MLDKAFAVIIYDLAYTLNGHFVFFSDRFKLDPIYEVSCYNAAIALAVLSYNPLVNECLHFGA
jgi:hypothetical protein